MRFVNATTGASSSEPQPSSALPVHRALPHPLEADQREQPERRHRLALDEADAAVTGAHCASRCQRNSGRQPASWRAMSPAIMSRSTASCLDDSTLTGCAITLRSPPNTTRGSDNAIALNAATVYSKIDQHGPGNYPL
jgi:hypothetical protein